jgi:hypothetical protein
MEKKRNLLKEEKKKWEAKKKEEKKKWKAVKKELTEEKKRLEYVICDFLKCNEKNKEKMKKIMQICEK